MKFETFLNKIAEEKKADQSFTEARLQVVAAEKEVMNELQPALVIAHNVVFGTFLESKEVEFIGLREDLDAGWRAVYRVVNKEVAIDFEMSMGTVLAEHAKLQRKSESSLLPIVAIAALIGAAGVYGKKLKAVKAQKVQHA